MQKCKESFLYVKVLHSICQQIWKTQQWPQEWKKSVFIPIPKKGNAKECSNYCTFAFVSHANKVMLILFLFSMNLCSEMLLTAKVLSQMG